MTRDQLCESLRSRWYLLPEEIQAILDDEDFFRPYLRNALAHRAKIASVPESPIDATDGAAIFLLTELQDTTIIPDLIKCLKMSDDDLRLLYSNSLTEHVWLPFAKLVRDPQEELWELVTDPVADVFARHAAVDGVVALHHFHPDRRAASVAFIERLLGESDAFPLDYAAGFLCDCADSGLAELAERAEAFVARMDADGEMMWPMATPDDVRRAFRNGAQKGYIMDRCYDVFTINEQWQRVAESWTEEEGEDDEIEATLPDGGGELFEDVMPGQLKKPKIGRNEPCPCGSGKKYEKCCGK